MKNLLLVIMFLVTSSSFARTGIGAMFGNPTGLNVKHWLGGNQAIDGGFGLTLGGGSHGSLHSDYLLHKNDAFYFNDSEPLDLYYGIGGRMKFADDIELGVRLPVGLVHTVSSTEADVFGEIAPVVDFIGRVGLDINLAIGARYYF